MTDVSAEPDPTDQSDAADPPTPPPVPPAGPRPFRLMRARSGKVFGGVACGIAKAAGIDPTVARLAVFAFCLTGVGLLAYFVLWLVLPQEAAWRGEVIEPAADPVGLYLRIGLVVAAVLGLLDVLGNAGGAWHWSRGNWNSDPGYFGIDFGGGLGLVLIGFGAALLITRRRGGPDDSMPPSPSGYGSSWTAPSGTGDYDPADYLDEPGTARSLIAARVIGWLTVVWAILAAAVGFFLWWVGALRPGAPQLAIPLGVAAFVFLVYTLIRSRRPQMILLALLLLFFPATLAGRVNFSGDFGVRDLRPTAATLEPTYRVATGQLILDLRDVEVPSGTRTVRIVVGLGDVQVRLPANVTSDVVARVQVGEVAVLGEQRGGTDFVARGHLDGCPENGRLVVDIRVRVGHVEVEGPGVRDASPVCAASPAR